MKGEDWHSVAAYEDEHVSFHGRDTERVVNSFMALLGQEFRLTPEGPTIVGTEADPVNAFWTAWTAYDEIENTFGEVPVFPTGGVLESPEEAEQDASAIY